MQFRRSTQRYGRTPAPETPFQRAAQIWDERIGSARLQARNWRVMAFGGLLLSAGLSSALVWQSMQSRVVPYVVEVDALGQAQAVAPAARGYTPTDPQIAWFLARLITDVRSVSLDPVLMRRNWLGAYDFVTGRGARILSEYARTVAPFAQLGERTVSVQVTSVVRASPTSFQLKWTETAYARGTVAGVTRWTAILTMVTRAPKSPEALRKNPLGLYVDALDWTRELDEPPAVLPTPLPPVSSATPLGDLPRGPAPADPFQPLAE